MTQDIEEKIDSGRDFKEFSELYNYLRSSIIYQRGLEGDFSDQTVTIEELLEVLSEINQKHRNKLYPFIGGWNIHLLKVAGDEFNKVSKLDKEIRSRLYKWININNYDKASYFRNFEKLVSEVGSAIRVFTLNYDICVERALVGSKCEIELGFNEERCWEASKFDPNENSDVGLYLYKLHGSIDWIKDKENGDRQTVCDNPQENAELIFGAVAKLSSIDPYLFYAHELRKYSLSEAVRFVVVVGYSFRDNYINGLISQAVTRGKYIKVLVISPSFEKESDISKELNVEPEKIVLEKMNAKDFFEKNMKLSYFTEKFGTGDDDPF